MKYMTFNASCSYAGLANLLSFYGVDTEDRKIALQMRLPYLFAWEDGTCLSGPMLQGAEWFNLYLHPIGFTFVERRLDREEVCACLRDGRNRMLGLRVSPESKHAVVYLGREKERYRFLNNKRKDSPEPEELCLTEEELLARLDGSVTVGALERAERTAVNYRSYLERSVRTFRDLRNQIVSFCGEEQSAPSLRSAMDKWFRPILLDGVTMLELLEETGAAEPLKAVRAQFLKIVRENRSSVLAEELDMERLCAAMAQYEELMIRQMETEQDNL